MPALQIDIEARFAKFQDTLDQVFRSTSKSAAGMSSAFGSVRHALEAIGVGLSVAGIVEFFSKAREAAIEFETSTKRLDAVFKNVGDSAGVSKTQIEEFADGLSKSTQFRADDLRNAASEILKFGKVHGDTFREALKVSADLAAFMGTNVSEAAREVGKALADPEHAMRLLKQAGVVLSEEQKDQLLHMIALGDKAGAQVIILKKLQAAYADVAVTMNTGLIKATNDVTKSWHEMLEEIGRSREGGDKGFLGVLASAMGGVAGNLKFKREELDYIDKSEEAVAARKLAARSGNIGTPGQTEARIAQLNAVVGRTPGKSTAVDTEAAYARDKINRQIDAGLTATHLATVKDILSKTQSELERFYSENLISEAQYYQNRRGLVEGGLKAELAAIDEGIKAQEHLLAHATSKGEIASASIELVKLSEQRMAVQRKASDEFQALTFADVKSAREFNKELAGIAETTLTLQHNTQAAAAIKAFDPNNDQRRKLNAEALSPNAERAAAAKSALEQLDLQGRLIVSKAALSDEELRFSQVLDQVSIAQQKIAIDAASGSITEIESLQRLSDVNKQRIADLTVIAERYEAIAKVSGDPADEIRAQRLRLEIHKLGSETDLVAKKFNDAFAGDLATALTSVADRTATVSDAFRTMAQSIIHNINAIASKNLAEAIFGKDKPGAGIGGWLAQWFGGGSSAAESTPKVQPGWGYSGADLVGEFASGTSYVPRTGLALVHKGEAIIPAGQNGGNVVNNFNFTGGPPIDPQAFFAQVAPVMDRMARGAARTEIGQQLRPGGAFN